MTQSRFFGSAGKRQNGDEFFFFLGIRMPQLTVHICETNTSMHMYILKWAREIYMFIWCAYTCSTNMRLIMPEGGDLSVSLTGFAMFPAKA